MASLATIFGSGAMTNSIREIEGTDVIFVIGSNTKEAQPVIANAMIAAKRAGSRIIVADPRKIPMCRFADIWLRQRPGTDIALLNSISHVILSEGLENREFIRDKTRGFDEWRKSVDEFTPETGEKITGVPRDLIIKAARLYGSSANAGIYYTMGITQQLTGTANVNAIANLALLTGNIGKQYAGINPLRGQNNVQGACDAGCLPNVYPGYQRVDLPEIREKFETAWGRTLSQKPGIAASEISRQALEGRIRALYVMGENPVLGDPNVGHTKKAFGKLDLLIVQDIFLTETARLADIVFPATCFAEKNGTFINTERRVQRVRKAVRPPGQAMEDLKIIAELSKRMGYEMSCSSPEVLFEELGSLWPALEGITYTRIESQGIQWPCPTKNHPGTEYLYKGGFPRGKASFAPVQCSTEQPGTDSEYPFEMITGRNLFQYHFGSMSRRVKSIELHAGEAYIEINNEDAAMLGLTEGMMVKVTSAWGSIRLRARSTDRVMRRTVFIPMHYGEAAVNILTDDSELDAFSKTPNYKKTAVRIEPDEKGE